MSLSIGTQRVLIVEEQFIYAKALAQVLAADPQIEVDVASGRDADALAGEVDVLIADRDSASFAGVARRVKSRFPHVKICDLRKDSSPQELLASVKRLKDRTRHADGVNELSPRERQIIALIAAGFSNRDIGQRLVLSEKTVKNHVSRIFTKIRCTARSQAAVHAIRTGLA